jgi:hypothetical protein
MKLTLIASQYPFSGRVPLVPPILEYLAALTLRELPEAEITQVDANQQDITPDEITTEVVAISAMTATVTWAYRFADACRKRGIHVILGGIHPTALPEEAAMHADTVVIGEAESVWGNVLRDISAGTPQKFYRGKRLPLVNLPKPVDGKLKGNYRFRAFFTMRGCPYRCTFCSVRRFFGDTIRYRPVPEVVKEVETCAGKIWFNGDDNIWGGDLTRSTELFSELARGTKRSWYGFGDLRSVQGPQGDRMLKAARESGLFSVWVGWESDDEHLRAYNASGKQGADRVAAVKKMQDAGIDVTLFVVLGGRQDSVESFRRTLDLSEKLNAGVHPVLLTPLPGTELYDAYREFLLPGLGWDSFVGVEAVFEHPSPDMTPVRREFEYHRLCQGLFRFDRIVKRTISIPRSGFPSTHLLSFMTQMPMKLAFGKAYDEWKSKVQKDVPEAGAGVAGAAVLPRGGEMSAAYSASQAGSGQQSSERRSFNDVPFRVYGLCLAAITALHFLQYATRNSSSSLERIYYALDLIEEIAFLMMAPAALAALFLRRRAIMKWGDTVRRIAGEKINRWVLAVKEFAYSALIGSGLYWAYACMVELI